MNRAKSLFIAYWVALFIIMHVPAPEGIDLHLKGGDKLLHGTVYFLLATLGAWAFPLRRVSRSAKWAVGWLIVYSAYAALDEILQTFVDRSCSFGDWVADVVGALIAIAYHVGSRKWGR